MVSNERCFEITKYITQLLYYNGKNITEEMKPQNKEEQDFFEREYAYKLKRKQEDENFQNKVKQANEEAELVVRKYLPKEYWSDGYFNSDEFIKLEEEVDAQVEREMEGDFLSGGPINLLLSHAGRISSSRAEVFFRYRKTHLLYKKVKKATGLDITEIDKYITKEYLNEIKEIENKYKINLDKYK